MPALHLTAPPPARTVSAAVRRKNFGLSPAEFEELRAALADGDQRLLEKVFLAHFEDCMKFLVSRDQVSKQVAYDATMAALTRFHDLILGGKLRYGNLRYLFTKMARQNYLQTSQRQRIFTALTDSAYDIPEEEPDFPDDAFGTMKRAFAMLGADCRELLRNYYYRERSLKNIAAAQGRGAPAVRKQKSRCVARLKRYFYLGR